MNEHEKLEEALDLLTAVSKRDAARQNDKYDRIAVGGALELEVINFLEKCGRFKFEAAPHKDYGIVYGYWADSKEKAAP